MRCHRGYNICPWLKNGSMKYAENLVATNIAKYTGLRSGTEVKFHALVWVVALVKGVRFKYVAAVGEKQKEKDLVVKYFIV